MLDHQRQFLSKLGGLEVPKLGVGAGVLLLTSVTYISYCHGIIKCAKPLLLLLILPESS